MPNFIRNSFILLLLAVLVPGLMVLYVKTTQFEAKPDDALQLQVVEDIIWPWQRQQGRLWVDFTPTDDGIATVGIQSLVFMIDTSSSVRDEDLLMAKQGILDFQRNMSQQLIKPPLVVVGFDGESQLVVNQRQSPEQNVAQRLMNMGRIDQHDTAILVGFEKVIAAIDPAQTNIVIIITDGHVKEPKEQLNRYYQTTLKPMLDNHKLDLYFIGIGDTGRLVDVYKALTSDDQKSVSDVDNAVLTSDSAGNLPSMLTIVASRLGNVIGRDGQLTINLAAPLWSVGTAISAVDATADGGADSVIDRPGTGPASEILLGPRQSLTQFDMTSGSAHFPIIFKRLYQWAIPLEPKWGGILTTLANKPRFSYFDNNGERQVVMGPDGAPKILVLSPLLLLLLLLPLLLYWLYALWLRLLRKKPQLLDNESTPYTAKLTPVANLPLAVKTENIAIQWTPSLIIGLGGTGREALTHLKQNIQDTYDKKCSRPVLLALDVASDEYIGSNVQSVAGCIDQLDEQQWFVLPEASRDLSQSIHLRFAEEHPAASLDLLPYREEPTDILRLNKGTVGQGTLARLALLNDLSQGANSPLIQRLEQALQQWRAIQPEIKSRQIQLIANVDGGIASGWLTDLIILLRRLVKADQQQGYNVEIVVLLQGKQTASHDNKVGFDNPVLFSELDRLASAGRYPFNHCLALASDHEALEGIVDYRPHDSIYTIVTNDHGDQAKVANVSAFLLDQRKKNEAAYSLHAIGAQEVEIRANKGIESYTQLSVHYASCPMSFFLILQRNRLVQLLLSEQVLLLDIQSKEAGLKIKFESPDPMVLLLGDQADSKQMATPLNRLLQGDRQPANWPTTDTEVIAEIQQVRSCIIENANLLLMQRKIGLLGLKQLFEDFIEQLTPANSMLVGSAELNDLAAQFSGIKQQIVTWLELLLGSEMVKANKMAPVLTAQFGLLSTVIKQNDSIRQKMDEWSQAPSRSMVLPSVGIVGENKQKNSKIEVDEWLETQFDLLLQQWLNDTDQVKALSERCYWQMAIPGLTGGPIGIHLTFRGYKTDRYKPDLAGVDQLTGDLQKAIDIWLKDVRHSHILSLLQQNYQQTSHQQWFSQFTQNLKGQLSGERSQLLVALPKVHQGQQNSRDITEFREKLAKNFSEKMSGSTEMVHVYESEDCSSISIFQAIPLLHANSQFVGTKRLAIHRNERLLFIYSKLLADALQLTAVQLPSVTSIALTNLTALREFARLFFAGEIRQHAVTARWQLFDGVVFKDLTHLPELTLAEAAVSYVSQWQQSIEREIPVAVQPSTDNGDHFIALLMLLLDENKEHQQ